MIALVLFVGLLVGAVGAVAVVAMVVMSRRLAKVMNVMGMFVQLIKGLDHDHRELSSDFYQHSTRLRDAEHAILELQKQPVPDERNPLVVWLTRAADPV